VIPTDQTGPRHQHADKPILILPSRPQQPNQITHDRAHPIRGDHQIRFQPTPIKQLQHTLRSRANLVVTSSTPARCAEARFGA
jgi:hypothetical protein